LGGPIAPLRPLCNELDSWKEALDYRGPLPRTWAGRLRRDLEAEAVAASTSMEGVPVTVEEVKRILAGETPPEVASEDRALVEGYRQAMNFVLRRADDSAFKWSRELIIGLHDRVLAGKYSQAGEEVPALVDEACLRMEEGHPHPAAASAWIHVAIAAIHPFKDGNGRSARVLASLAMYRGGFKRPEFTSLEEWWGRHLADYYEAFGCLGHEFDEADVTPFLRAHVQAQLHQVRALDMREKVQRQIWTALEELAEELHMHPRVAKALWEAFFGRAVTAGYYRSLADVSPATATKDLAAVVTSGLLMAEGDAAADATWRRSGSTRLWQVSCSSRSVALQPLPEIGSHPS
jgi:Fic/DOC family protein